MAAAGNVPDAYKEICLVGIIPEAPTGEIAFAGIIEDVTGMDWGDKEIEGKALVNGGRVATYTPMGDESITFKVYPVDVLVDTGGTANGVAQLFHPQYPSGTFTEDTTQPVVVDNSRYRHKHGIILLWAETYPATAGTLPAISKAAMRVQIINAYMTRYKPSFDGKTLTAEVTFKWTPFAKDGTRNKREESTDGSVQLAAAITTATSY